MRCGSESRNMRMFSEKLCDRFAQRAGAVAVNYAHFAEAVQEGGVEKFVGEVDSFVCSLADQVQFIVLETCI